MLKCVTDTETTGLDELLDEIHQIAAVVTDENYKPFDVCNIKWRPSELALSRLTPEASNKLGFTQDDLRARKKTAAEAAVEWEAFLRKHVNKFDANDKMQFVAYNSIFDEKFLRAFMTAHDTTYGSYFWHPSLCVMRQCAWLIQDERNRFGNLSLANMCKFAEIEFDDKEAHDALYDVKKTLELAIKVR
jgi:DNA polymerase III epsilon subunit-like protein